MRRDERLAGILEHLAAHGTLEVADVASALGVRAFAPLGGTTRFHGIVTDASAPPAQLEGFRERGSEVVVA